MRWLKAKLNFSKKFVEVDRQDLEADLLDGLTLLMVANYQMIWVPKRNWMEGPKLKIVANILMILDPEPI